MSNIAVWLDNLGLSKYVDVFTENDIEIDVLPDLTEEHLKELGISLGHRVKLLKAISALSSQQRKGSQSTETLAEADSSLSSTAERRQLTVMFCDLVGSTALSSSIDPEELSILMRRYQDTVVGEISRYEGYLAKFMGDGILVYFGYPQAHEDAAGRALRAALAIPTAMQALNAERSLVQGQKLAVRIGIATGVVVVGDLIGEGVSAERNVVGETPNLAARLQNLARPNDIVIGSVTRDLAGDDFLYEDLGLQALKGIVGKVKVWGVLGEREPDENEASTDERPLLGRQEELGLLKRAWLQSQSSAGQVVLISGEPGIGKSRLVDAVSTEAKAGGYVRNMVRCSPYHTNSALYPVVQYLQRLLGGRQEDSAEQKLAALEQAIVEFESLPENAVPLLAALLSLTLPEQRYRALQLSPQQQKQQTVDVLVAWMNEAAERQPSVWVWEDLHWADPSTLELLAIVIEQCPTVPILHALTYRPDFTPPWPMRSHMTPLTLNRLERTETEALIAYHAGGKALPQEVVEHIVSKADGVPLYVEELSKTIIAADFMRDAGDRYQLTAPLSGIVIPATLQDSLMERLDRLPQAREVAQFGSVFGREFSYQLLAPLIGLSESALRASLARLVEEELLYQRGRPPQARYIFKHALIQDIAYESLLKRTRQRYHRQVAELLQDRFPELARTEPELLAHHYTRAGLTEQALTHWQQAGLQANERSAHQEAVSHLQTGLELLQTLPETQQRDRQELALQTALGNALLVIRGHSAPEVEATYLRARALCQQFGDTRQLFLILLGLWRCYNTRADFPLGRQLAEELIEQAERSGEMSLWILAQFSLSTNYFWTGDLLSARGYFKDTIKDYIQNDQNDPLFRVAHDPGVGSYVLSGTNLWLLGYPDQAKAQLRAALALASELNHPISCTYALCFSAMVSQMLHDKQAVYEYAHTAITLCSEQGFDLYLAIGSVLKAWQMDRDQGEEKLARILQGLADWRATGAQVGKPYFLTLLADVYRDLGQINAALDTVDEALAPAERSGENWWKAEVHRCRGELLLLQTTPDTLQAETCFQQALDIAREQQAKSLELRAAISLARLWQKQAKNREAYELLASVYNWFTEGFDTADLKDAKTLLDELA